MMRIRWGALSCAFLVCGVPSWAQQISGSINGFVKDVQQGAIVDAKIVLTDQAQGSARETRSAPDGAFVLTPVQPGTYSITIESSGFKKFEQRDVKVFANDHVSLGNVILNVGAITDTITVEGQVVQVQSSSAERSGVLTSRQVLDLAENGRNFLDLVKTLPGVVYTGGLGGIQANGNRGNQNNLTVDGVTNVDTGSNGGTLATTNIDMIAEMKVITNSQQAEFGRSSGAQIEVVTKS
jgi:outer membrane receptor protein involved in Fe transport